MKILHFLIFFLLQIYNISGKDNLVKMDEIYFKDTNYAKLKEYIEKYKNQIAVSVVPLENSHTPFFYNKSEVFVSASMIKLLILCEFIEEIDHETIYLDQNYTYEEKDYVEGAGEIQKMPFGTIFNYDTLTRYMIKYSDNIATNVLIDILGMDNINNRSQILGLKATELNRKMMKEGEQNYMSAEDIEIILKGILYKTLGSKEMCQRGMEYLLENDDTDAIVRGLPNGTVFAHKTGSLDKIRHDGGIVFIENKYIIIILTKDFQLEDDANYLMGNISSIVYKIMNETSPQPGPESDTTDPTQSNDYIKNSLIALIMLISLLI
jgi:beta-lactamase class A